MARRLIVNCRGANAAGKTTLMRNFLVDPSMIQVKAPDGTRVDLQASMIPGLELPVTVIGKYDEGKYSGCDKIKSVEAIKWAVRYALEKGHGHVMFEGFRVSKSYGPFASLRNQLVDEFPVTWLWALLHASKELIWERAAARREDGKPIDKEELAGVVRQMNNTRQNVMFNWPGDVLTLDPTQSPGMIHGRLLSEMVAREAGQTLGSK